MATPALRELKRRNPGCHITFYNNYPDLVAGLPFIDQVRPIAEAPQGTIWLTYEMLTWKRIQPRRHLAQIMGDELALDVRHIRPSCMFDPAERDRFREAWKSLPHPWIILNRHASDWTPNKEWPHDHWESLVDRLLIWSSVIEVGLVSHPDRGRDPGHYLNLAGQLSRRQLAAAIAAADLHLGPISGPTHIAAAFQVPSAVIYGGYEDPISTGYDGNINLFSSVACAPCWLRDKCPLDRVCLRQIEPATVERALKQLWHPTVSPGHA